MLLHAHKGREIRKVRYCISAPALQTKFFGLSLRQNMQRLLFDLLTLTNCQTFMFLASNKIKLSSLCYKCATYDTEKYKQCFQHLPSWEFEILCKAHLYYDQCWWFHIHSSALFIIFIAWNKNGMHLASEVKSIIKEILGGVKLLQEAKSS